jgi:hypothetical protein
MTPGKEGPGNSQSSSAPLNTCLAAGITSLVVGYVLGSRNSTPQYAAILGGALLCFAAGLIIVMWQFAKSAKRSTRSFQRASAWVVTILMAASGALLTLGTLVD